MPFKTDSLVKFQGLQNIFNIEFENVVFKNTIGLVRKVSF